jgi:hypothetical protein
MRHENARLLSVAVGGRRRRRTRVEGIQKKKKGGEGSDLVGEYRHEGSGKDNGTVDGNEKGRRPKGGKPHVFCLYKPGVRDSFISFSFLFLSIPFFT